jgi:hypothetical protein
MAFDFPASPSDGTLYKPSGGPTYRYTGGVWTVVQPASNMAFIQDTPPTSPAPVHGQLWWESDTGALYVYFDDGNSQQWVQINGLSLGAAAPAYDGKEYVLVNGVWRMVRQTMAPDNGAGSLNIPVPTGAKHCHIGGHVMGATANLAPALRISFDGTTVISGASDYVYGGQAMYTGSSGSPAKVVPASTSYWPLIGYTDRTTEALFLDVDVYTYKAAGPYFGFRSRGWSYHSAATAVFQEFLYAGYTGSAYVNQTEIKMIQLTCSGGTYAGAPNSHVIVDWAY